MVNNGNDDPTMPSSVSDTEVLLDMQDGNRFEENSKQGFNKAACVCQLVTAIAIIGFFATYLTLVMTHDDTDSNGFEPHGLHPGFY
jgi:hypothetical protein